MSATKVKQAAYTVKRVVREEAYGSSKAGSVEWHVVDSQWGESVEVWPTKRQATAHAEALNKAE